VVACDGFTSVALIGDLMAGMMRNKRVAAFITDGMARDRAGVLATGLPLFCQGFTPNSAAMCGPGTVGAPVTLGGVHVCSGDIVVGDGDSVVVVPAARAEQVLAALERVRAAEADMDRLVSEGLTMSEAALRLVQTARIVATG
jgi:regulator of RNase E activity RraA